MRELTVYSFSTENWSRPLEEVAALMAMFSERILAETPGSTARACGRFIGRREVARPSCSTRWRGRRSRPPPTERITLYVAFNYGGRAEIIDAARRFEGATEEEFPALLYAPEMHDPDLIIRTASEQRPSNYLLWQSAYLELHFTEVLWPDFSREDFEAALESSRCAGAGSAADEHPPAPPPRRLGPRRPHPGRDPRDRPCDLHHRRRRLIFFVGILVLGVVCLHELFRVRPRAADYPPSSRLGLRLAALEGESGRSCSPWWRSCR